MKPDSHEKAASGTDWTDETDMTDELRWWDLSPEGAAYGMKPDSHEEAAAGTDPTDETDMTDEVRWRPGGVGSP